MPNHSAKEPCFVIASAKLRTISETSKFFVYFFQTLYLIRLSKDFCPKNLVVSKIHINFAS